MTQEEITINSILALTKEGVLRWYVPQSDEDPAPILPNYEKYITSNQDGSLFIIAKHLARKDKYVFFCLENQSIPFAVEAGDLEDKFLLRTLFDYASQEFRQRYLEQLRKRLAELRNQKRPPETPPPPGV